MVDDLSQAGMEGCMMVMRWVLYSHAARGYVVGDGTYAAKCQDARPFCGAHALRMASEFPGDIEAVRVWVENGVDH